MTHTTMGGPNNGTILPQLPPSTEFESVPKSLFLEIDNGPSMNYCGVVMSDKGDPVLVAVFRRKHAASNIGYQPPALSYLTELAQHKEVVRANFQWRLPVDDTELRLLVTGLSKES